MEAAHVLYSMNTFSFQSKEGWLGYLIFSRQLLNKHFLRTLKFSPEELSDCPRTVNYALGEVAHTALRAINLLPELNRLILVTRSNLSTDHWRVVSKMCYALNDTQCSLTLLPPRCDKHFPHYRNQQLPKIHHAILATFWEYGWKLTQEFEVVNTLGALYHGGLCRR